MGDENRLEWEDSDGIDSNESLDFRVKRTDKMIERTRRDFLKVATVGIPMILTSPTILAGVTVGAEPAEGANERLRVGHIGLGGMGRGDASDFSNLADEVALCDVDGGNLAEAAKSGGIGTKRDGQKVGTPDTYGDYRRVLDRNDIDIVAIGTCDHWHVKIAIEAMQAGKHVFCQKPLTFTIEEGELIRRACVKYSDRVFQVGTQQRAQRDQFALATLMIRKGLLGDIKKMIVNIGPSPVGGPFPLADVPETFDYEMWCGQCPKVPYRTERCLRTFRYWYEYAGGTFTDWGAHHLDFVHWALDYSAKGQGPTRITPTTVEHPVALKDGYPTTDDRFNTCTKFDIQCQFGDTEVRVCSHTPDGNGVLVEGTKGRMNVNREQIKGTPMEEKWYDGVVTEDDFTALAHGKSFDGWHKRNFLTCVREGGLPISDAFSHVQAMNSCHLVAIAARLGRELVWNPTGEKFDGDEQAQSFTARERRVGYDIPQV